MLLRYKQGGFTIPQKMLDEDTIFNNLHSIAFQDFSPEPITTSYPALPPRNHSFRQVSDWHHRYQQKENAKESFSNKIGSNSLERAGSLAHYLEKHMPGTRRRRLGVSPVQRINMQFGSQWAKKKLPKDTPSQPQKEGILPMFSTSYSPLSKLYERKRKEREKGDKEARQEKINCVLIEESSGRSSLPRTERMSGYMRQMQKRQKMQGSPRIRQHNLPTLIKSP